MTHKGVEVQVLSTAPPNQCQNQSLDIARIIRVSFHDIGVATATIQTSATLRVEIVHLATGVPRR